MTRRMLITGGAGFIGVNSALAFSRKGWNVTVFDNFSRKGAHANVDWLLSQAQVEVLQSDVRDRAAVDSAVANTPFDAVLHLAAQVAVTTSVAQPREDFEINAHGTFNVLDAVRRLRPQAHFIYASTNKVYGKLEHVGVAQRNGRYEYESLPGGVTEQEKLDFHSPYGCSKGAADQYTIDFGRIYGLKTTCFRQSCIYGPRQFGVEDQGWVAWFIIATVLGKPITIYGDGMQIRDLLHVDDLIDAYDAALAQPQKAAGEAFNIGGGPSNTLSLLELVEMLRALLGQDIPLRFDSWRPGDQPVFVCDTRKALERIGWAPKISPLEGVARLLQWVQQNKRLFQEPASALA